MGFLLGNRAPPLKFMVLSLGQERIFFSRKTSKEGGELSHFIEEEKIGHLTQKLYNTQHKVN
jgi:hypothetical protein